MIYFNIFPSIYKLILLSYFLTLYPFSTPFIIIIPLYLLFMAASILMIHLSKKKQGIIMIKRKLGKLK